MFESLRKFYESKQWRKIRKLKLQQKHGLCERCYKAGKEVHHKTYLTEANVNNLEISLGLDNLEVLCKKCHDIEHGRLDEGVRDDLAFDKNGDLVKKVPRLEI